MYNIEQYKGQDILILFLTPSEKQPMFLTRFFPLFSAITFHVHFLEQEKWLPCD